MARKVSDKLEQRIKKVEPEKIALSTKNNLPDLPPEFPKDFNKITETSHNNLSKNKLKYPNGKEDFDLPEIDNITELFDNNKSRNRKQNDVKTSQKDIDTHMVTGESKELYSNAENLNSEALLNELELMVNEYEKNDNFAITGGRDE